MIKKYEHDYLIKTPLTELIKIADEIKRKFIKKEFEVCSIINAKSGLCAEDCKFCAQSSKYKTSVTGYPLVEIKEIYKSAKKAKKNGAKKFGIVTSGDRLSEEEINKIIKAIVLIRENIEIEVCASLGSLEKTHLQKLKKAGLKRYHHNIETSAAFYKKIVSSHKFNDRLKTIRNAKDAGLEVCSGGIIGMGERWIDRISMAELLAELDVDSVPINVHVPIPGTPLEKNKPINCLDVIRTIAIFRIILKDKIIKMAAGRETVLKDFQALCFMAGANGMLIGGYLTIKGRKIEDDKKLINDLMQDEIL